MALMMFFQLKTGSERLDIMNILEEKEKLAQVWTMREFCCSSESTCTVWCVYSQKWMSLWLLSSEPSSFPKQKLMCQGVVSIQSCSERKLGCGQDVHLKTRTAGVIMKNAILINFLSFPPNPWFRMQECPSEGFWKCCTCLSSVVLCLLLWHLLPPESRLT